MSFLTHLRRKTPQFFAFQKQLRFKTTYTIKIETSGRKSSSIQNPAFIQLIGDKGASPIITLTPPQSGFRQGSLTLFSITLEQSIGKMHHIQLGHSGVGNWLVQNVEIEDSELREKWRFPCYLWIKGTSKEDFNIQLYPIYQPPVSTKKERILSFICGASSIPHIDKELRGERGEDAYFAIDRSCVSTLSTYNAMGIADGVSEWKMAHGLDAGEYARQLMDICEEIIYSRETVTPHSILQEAKWKLDQTKTPGSCTCGLCLLDRSKYLLHTFMLGDSKIIVVRDGRILYSSTSQQHSFGHPYQFANIGGDSPNEREYHTLKVQSGDMILLATDGLFDNIYENVLCNHIWRLRCAQPSQLAAYLTSIAKEKSVSDDEETPWSREASENLDMVYKGGKKDDITAVIGRIVSEKRDLY